MRIIIFSLLLILVCSAAASVKKQLPKEKEPLIHEYIKLALWLLSGVVVGVFFEAKMQLKDLLRPLAQKGLTGIIIAFGIYGIFMFASHVSRYL